MSYMYIEETKYMGLNKKQSGHLQSLVAKISDLTIDKYTKGALEHNSNLLDMDTLELLDESINEAIDQLVYLLTLREKLSVCDYCGCDGDKHYPTCYTFNK